MKYLHSIYLLYIGAVMLLGSCSSDKMEELFKPLVKAPGATIERKVKGHDQIYSVQAILRLSLRRADGYSYAAYGLSSIIEPPIPIYQQIDISKDDDGRISITSNRKCFDVVKSSKYYYALELKYYDLNGKLINHQFSHYDQKDSEGSTLLHHQHFFTLQSYALDGRQLVYPMTLDSIYHDEFTFQRDTSGRRIASTELSPSNVYVPIDNDPTSKVAYHASLAQRAVEKSTTKEAREVYTDPSGKKYRLYRTLNLSQLNAKAHQVFTYLYRDTDPVEDYLHGRVKGLDDLGRQRVGKNVQLLQRNRDLTTQAKPDYLGFKGMLQFKQSNMAFQMRICIAHMITPTEKYIGMNNVRGVLHEHDEISPSWNSYDIDYPLAFRVMADADGNPTDFVREVKRFYPRADETRLLKMFANDPDWFRHIPQISF